MGDLLICVKQATLNYLDMSEVVMDIENMTMTKKLLIIRRMIEHGELLVVLPAGQDTDEIFDELAANFTQDRDRIKITI